MFLKVVGLYPNIDVQHADKYLHQSRPLQREKQAIGDTISPHKLLQQNEQKKRFIKSEMFNID